MAEFVFLSIGTPPLGQEILRQKLNQEGINTRLFSMNNIFKRVIDGGDDARSRKKAKQFQKEAEEYLQELKQKISAPAFIGMTFFDSELEKNTSFFVARNIKRFFPGAKLIAGGPAFNSNPVGFFRETKADYAIAGEAENALPKLIKILTKRSQGTLEEVEGIVFRKNRRIIRNPPARITREEIQNASFVSITRGKFASTYSERGCPNACVFCTVPRKGNPAQLKEETIIEGIKALARNKEIKVVSLIDDQFFADKARANRIMDRIIALGLNKRFEFDYGATIESLLKNGKPDIALIRKIKQSGTVLLQIGTEALNNNMLKELKGGRYTKEQAIAVLKALRENKIHTASFMLAGGIETRARDFLESYYNAKSLSVKRKIYFHEMATIAAIKGTPIQRIAEKEKLLFTIAGREATMPKRNGTGQRFVLPRDPHLRKLLIEKLKKDRSRSIGVKDEAKVLKMANESQDPVALKYARKIQKLSGQAEARIKLTDKFRNGFLAKRIENELTKQGIALTPQNANKFLTTPNGKRLTEQSEKLVGHYAQSWIKAYEQEGIERLRTIQKMRKKHGVGMTTRGKRLRF
ncbi:MAG: radical SAM protein [archaeon]|jgi:radical SAM superfamily enzyme YgiQ (UPF0313 family)